MPDQKKARVLVIGGPTATGKTELAIEVSRRWGATIVSADAMTVYRGMNIGTAKPTAEVLSSFPHACVDVRWPNENFTVADFTDQAEAIVRSHDRVVIAGGTPFYLRALIHPLATMPNGDDAIRAELGALPDPYAELCKIDPECANRLHPNDRVRVIRALEVHAITGKTLTELHAEEPRRQPLDAEFLWIDREGLRDRIDTRLQMMLSDGYVEETEGILKRWGSEIKPLRSFAYRHIVDHLDQKIPIDEALRRTERDTWLMARKQRMWARGQKWNQIEIDDVYRIAENVYEKSLM